MYRSLTMITCTMALIASLSPCSAHSRPEIEFRKASTGEIYFQPTPPLEAKEGELWVDSRNGNQFYFLNGAWAFENLGTAIASAPTDNAIQMASNNKSSNHKANNATQDETKLGSPNTNPLRALTQPMALHEPQPLAGSDATGMVANSHDNHETQGASATPVLPATYPDDKTGPESALSEKSEQNMQNKSKNDGSHMSLTDALNADELVDLLRAIGASH